MKTENYPYCFDRCTKIISRVIETGFYKRISECYHISHCLVIHSANCCVYDVVISSMCFESSCENVK